MSTLQTIRKIEDESPGIARCELLPDSSVKDPLICLRAIAVSRLFLDNIEDISLPWHSNRPTLSELALQFGASSLGAAHYSHLGSVQAPKMEYLERLDNSWLALDLPSV